MSVECGLKQYKRMNDAERIASLREAAEKLAFIECLMPSVNVREKDEDKDKDVARFWPIDVITEAYGNSDVVLPIAVANALGGIIRSSKHIGEGPAPDKLRRAEQLNQ